MRSERSGIFLAITILCVLLFSVTVFAADDACISEKILVYLSSSDVVSDPELEKALYEGIVGFVKKIDISAFSVPATAEGRSYLKICFSNVRDDHPELFYLDNTYYVFTAGGCFSALGPVYTMTPEEADAAMLKVEDEYRNIVRNVRSDMSSPEKMLAVYDYFATHYEYDYENYLAGKVPEVSYTLLGVMLNKIGVCQSYSFAYEFVLTRLGIECTTVTSDSMGHMWNLVRIGDNWYHVDACWGDPAYDKCGRVDHSYFLVSDSTMMDAEHGHSGWSASVKCTDASFEEMPWVDSESTVAFDKNNMYIILKNGEINAYYRESGEVKNIFTVKDKWRAPSGGYYVNTCSRIILSGGRIYFNTPGAIMSVGTDGTELACELEIDTEESIFGMYGDNGVIYYATASDYSGYLPADGSIEISSEGSIVYGDCNGDGEVSILDSVLMAQYLAGWDVTFEKSDLCKWDVDPDGEINTADAILIVQYIAGWAVTLGQVA